MASEIEYDVLALLLGVQEAELGRLLRNSHRVVRVKAREMIYKCGAASHALYFVPSQYQEAVVEIRSEGIGRSSLVERVSGGQIFGDIEYLGRSAKGTWPARIHDAEALTQADVLEIRYALFDRLTRDQAATFVAALAARAFERLRQYGDLVTQARFSDKHLQLARWLLETAEDLGQHEADGIRIYVRFNQADVGTAVGLSREAVSLQFTEWERGGLLKRDSEGLKIADLDRLHRLVKVGRDRNATVHAEAVREIDRAIDRGDHLRGRNIGADMLKAFPRSSEIKHRIILATLRMEWWAEALRLVRRFEFSREMPLSDLKQQLMLGLIAPASRRRKTLDSGQSLEEEVDDPGVNSQELVASARYRLPALLEDVLSLEGRLWKGAAVDAPIEARDIFLRRAFDAYSAAFQATGGTYSAVNAASLAFVLGDTETAKSLATKVVTSIGAGKDFWSLTTGAECEYLLGRDAKAQAGYERAVLASDATEGKIAVARRQLRQLGELTGNMTTTLLSAIPQARILAIGSGCSIAGVEGLFEKASQTFMVLEGDDDVTMAEKALKSGCKLQLVLVSSVPRLLERMKRKDSDGSLAARTAEIVRAAHTLTTIGGRSSRARGREGDLALATTYCIGQCLLLADTLEADVMVYANDRDSGTWDEAAWRELAKLLSRIGIQVTVEGAVIASPIGKQLIELRRQLPQGIMTNVESTENGGLRFYLLGSHYVADAFHRFHASVAADRKVRIQVDADLFAGTDGAFDERAAALSSNLWQGYVFPASTTVLTLQAAGLLRAAMTPPGLFYRFGRVDPQKADDGQVVPSRTFLSLKRRDLPGF